MAEPRLLDYFGNSTFHIHMIGVMWISIRKKSLLLGISLAEICLNRKQLFYNFSIMQMISSKQYKNRDLVQLYRDRITFMCVFQRGKCTLNASFFLPYKGKRAFK